MVDAIRHKPWKNRNVFFYYFVNAIEGFPSKIYLLLSEICSFKMILSICYNFVDFIDFGDLWVIIDRCGSHTSSPVLFYVGGRLRNLNEL